MQPQTVSEVIMQHYANSPLNLELELKPKLRRGFILSDLDQTIEQEDTPPYTDLIFERVGAINKYFGEKLPVIKKNIGLAYQLEKIRGPVDEISRDFRISGVTRRQIKKVTKWALKKYHLNVGMPEFTRTDVPNLKIGYILNTGNFDYPVYELVGHYQLKIDKIYCSRLVYSNETDDGVVTEIIPNILWNKQAVNQTVAENFGLPHQALITIAESPKYEKFLPILSGLAIWVDPEAYKLSVPSRINIYQPKARRNMRELTRNIANWQISAINSQIETKKFQENVVAAIDEIKGNEKYLESQDSTEVEKASLRIANESKILVERMKRHNPSTAERMIRYIHIITADTKTETRKSYGRKLISEVESSFAESIDTKELMEEIKKIR